jgi:MFS family permease
MSEMIDDKPTSERPMPPPPEDAIEPERVEGAEERWAECPLRDCKRNPELLYADFYLRDMRTNRLMCSACTVRTDAGYMAREVVRAHDDRFFTGKIGTDGIAFGVMFAGSLIANTISMLIGFFYFGFIIGGAIGGGLAIWARRLSGKKVTRQTQYYGIAGIILGAILAPTVFVYFQSGFFVNPFILMQAYFIQLAACTAGIVLAARGVLMRRI